MKNEKWCFLATTLYHEVVTVFEMSGQFDVRKIFDCNITINQNTTRLKYCKTILC